MCLILSMDPAKAVMLAVSVTNIIQCMIKLIKICSTKNVLTKGDFQREF